jgi:hypothetical protein
MPMMPVPRGPGRPPMWVPTPPRGVPPQYLRGGRRPGPSNQRPGNQQEGGCRQAVSGIFSLAFLLIVGFIILHIIGLVR